MSDLTALAFIAVFLVVVAVISAILLRLERRWFGKLTGRAEG